MRWLKWLFRPSDWGPECEWCHKDKHYDPYCNKLWCSGCHDRCLSKAFD